MPGGSRRCAGYNPVDQLDPSTLFLASIGWLEHMPRSRPIMSWFSGNLGFGSWNHGLLGIASRGQTNSLIHPLTPMQPAHIYMDTPLADLSRKF